MGLGHGVDLGGELTVEGVCQIEIQQGDEDGPGQQQRRGIVQGEPDADGGVPAVHGSRYPVPETVSITGGSPSLRRRFMMVNRTTLVNGSVCSSDRKRVVEG